MKLKAKLENLYAMVENISMSLHPPPGKLGVIDSIRSSVYRFFVLFPERVLYISCILFSYRLFLQGTV